MSPADPNRPCHGRHLLIPLFFSGQSLYKGKSSVEFLASAKNKRPAPEAEAEADTSSRKSPRRERSSAQPENADGDVYEFTEDSREEERASQRVSRPPVSPNHKKPQTRKPRRTQAPESTSADNAPLAPSAQEHSSGEDDSPPPPPSSTATTRRPQRRAFWEKEDERTLRELVAAHGSFWVYIEKKATREELFLVPRTQQQIRDKARNMKVDYLKYVFPGFPPNSHSTIGMLSRERGRGCA